MSLLRTDGLTVTIGKLRLCSGLNLAIEPGQCWAVLGPNGSGKTTLLHTLAGLRAPEAGRIHLDETALESIARKQLARRIGLMPQDNSDPFPMQAFETAMLGRYPYLSSWKTLSGGERRRLAFATLLVQDPALMLLDEPTNHLDLHQQIKVLGRIRELTRTGDKSAMLVLHDINLAARYCDHCLMLMPDGSHRQGGTEDLFTTELLSELYSWPMQAVNSEAGRVWVPEL